MFSINKKYLKIIIIIIIALVLAIVALYFVYKNGGINVAENKKIDILSEDEKISLNLYHLGVYEAVSRDSDGKVTAYKFIKSKNEEPIAVEIMTDAEKQSIGFSPSTQIQILQRDSQGKVIAYRLIKNESDIITKY